MELKSVQTMLLLAAALPYVWAAFDRPYPAPPPFAAAAHRLSPVTFSHSLQLARHRHKFSPLPPMPRAKAAKRPKYVLAGKLPPGVWKSAADAEKIPMGLLSAEPFRPTVHGLNSFEETIKPVTEHIEGDLMYDFRTNTHSI